MIIFCSELKIWNAFIQKSKYSLQLLRFGLNTASYSLSGLIINLYAQKVKSNNLLTIYKWVIIRKMFKLRLE